MKLPEVKWLWVSLGLNVALATVLIILLTGRAKDVFGPPPNFAPELVVAKAGEILETAGVEGEAKAKALERVRQAASEMSKAVPDFRAERQAFLRGVLDNPEKFDPQTVTAPMGMVGTFRIVLTCLRDVALDLTPEQREKLKVELLRLDDTVAPPPS